MTQEQYQWLKDNGYDPAVYDVDEQGNVFENPIEQARPKKAMSAPRAFGTSFLGSVLPSAAGLAAGAKAGALGGSLAGLPGTIIGAIGGGLVGGYGAGKLQEAALEKFAPEVQQELARAQTDQPVAAYLGGFAPNVLALRPSFGGIKGLTAPAMGMSREATRAAFIPAAVNVGSNVAGATAGQLVDLAQGGEFSGPRFAADVALGSLFSDPTRIGRRLGLQPLTPEVAAPERLDLAASREQAEFMAYPPSEFVTPREERLGIGRDLEGREQFFTPEGERVSEKVMERDYTNWWKSETEPTTELLKGAAEEVKAKIPKERLKELSQDPEVGEVLRDPSKMPAFIAKQADQTLEDVFQMMERRRSREFATAEEAANQKALQELRAERGVPSKTALSDVEAAYAARERTPETEAQKLYGPELAGPAAPKPPSPSKAASGYDLMQPQVKQNATEAAREVYTRLQRPEGAGENRITQQDIDFAAEVAARRGLKIELDRAFSGDQEVRGMYFVDKDGNRIIRVNPLMATADTAIHEVGHDVFERSAGQRMKRSLLDTALDSPAYKSELAARQAEVDAGRLTPEGARDIALEEGLIQAFGEQMPGINRGELRSWFRAFKASIKQLATGKLSPEDALAWLHYASTEAVPWKGAVAVKGGEERFSRAKEAGRRLMADDIDWDNMGSRQMQREVNLEDLISGVMPELKMYQEKPNVFREDVVISSEPRLLSNEGSWGRAYTTGARNEGHVMIDSALWDAAVANEPGMRERFVKVLKHELGHIDDAPNIGEYGAARDERVADEFAARYQRAQQETPEFKNWFGDSKVVDMEGKPKFLYHGTGADITQFEKGLFSERALYGPGIYMTESADVAGGLKGYAFKGLKPDDATAEFSFNENTPIDEQIKQAKEQALKEGFTPAEVEDSIFVPGDDATIYMHYQENSQQPNAMPLYAKIEKPFDIDAIPENWTELAEKMDETATRLFGDKYRGIDFDRLARAEVFDNISNRHLYDDLVHAFEKGEPRKAYANKVLQAMGYDGITHTGGLSQRYGSGKPHQVWIAFEPEQVKSATGNRGTFSPESRDIRYQRAPVDDASYLKAVEAGDMETAQRMVDEAANKAGYTTRAYHGRTKDFTIFSRDVARNVKSTAGDFFYFTDSRSLADMYSGVAGRYDIGRAGNVLSAFLSLRNPLQLYTLTRDQVYALVNQINKLRAPGTSDYTLELDNESGISFQSDTRNSGPINFYNDDGNSYRFSTNIERLENSLGVKMSDVVAGLGHDGVSFSTDNDNQIYGVIEPSQIKSADPITRDDAGNIIPLSKRFQAESPDIRYQRSLLSEAKTPAELDYLASKGGPFAEVARSVRNAYNTRDFKQGQWSSKYSLTTALPEEARVRLLNHLANEFDSGVRSTPAADLRAAYDQIRNEYLPAIVNDYNAKGFMVRDTAGLRARGSNPTYFPLHAIADEVKTILTTKQGSPEWDKLKADFINWNTQLRQADGASLAEAQRYAQEKFADTQEITARPPGIESGIPFSGARKPEGYPLPPSWRSDDIIEMLNNYTRRSATDFAYQQHVESSPVAMAALGAKTMLNNQPIPANVLQSTAPVITDPSVQSVLREYRGTPAQRTEGLLQSAGRLTSAATIGTVSKVGDIGTSMFKGLAYLPPSEYAAGLAEFVNKIADFAALKERSYASGLNKRDAAENMRQVLGIAEDSTAFMDKAARLLSKVTLVNELESVARTIAQGWGETIVGINKKLALGGDKNATQMLDTLSPDWRTRSDADLAAQVGRLLQGSYDMRQLPASVLEGAAAPYLTWSKWSIGQYDSFVKYAIQPAMQGNMKPLIGQMLIGLLGGGAVSAVQEWLNNREGKDITWGELESWMQQNQGEIGSDGGQLLAQKLLTMAQKMGTFGFAGDLTKMIVDAMAGGSAQGIATMPAVDAIYDVSKRTAAAIQALDDGEDFGLVMKALMKDSLVGHVQALRVARNWLDEDENLRYDDRRRQRLYDALSGLPSKGGAFSVSYSNLSEREFERGEIGEETGEEAMSLVSRAREQATTPEDYASRIRKLKTSQNQIMPSLERQPMKAARYLSWLEGTEEGLGSETLRRYMVRRGEDEYRKSLVEGLSGLR